MVIRYGGEHGKALARYGMMLTCYGTTAIVTGNGVRVRVQVQVRVQAWYRLMDMTARAHLGLSLVPSGMHFLSYTCWGRS